VKCEDIGQLLYPLSKAKTVEMAGRDNTARCLCTAGLFSSLARPLLASEWPGHRRWK
jgi:hypothetical protein